MARKKTVKEDTKIETTQGVNEQVPEVVSQEAPTLPTEAVQEESTETKADVPEIDNIAVIEAQEVTDPTEKLEYSQDEWNDLCGITSVDTSVLDEALINLTPVGAEVVEKALADNPELSREFVEEALKATQEVLEGDTSSYENSEDNYTEADEDGDGVPEHYVFDWANQPVAATLIHLRETKINSLVEKVMFASMLGGELYKSGVQLNRVPYRASVLIPNDKVEQFLSGEGKLEYEEDFSYTDVTVKGVSSHLFLKRVMGVSKKGAVIAPLKKVVNNRGFVVSLKCKAPVAQSASLQLGAQKPTYTLEELKAMSAESLKIICGWFQLPWRGKVQARIDLMEYYKGKENGQESK